MQDIDTILPVAPTSATAESVKHTPLFAVRLRLSISSLFLCLILPSFILFVFYIYQTNYEIYKKNAAELINNHNDQTSDKLFALLDPIRDSLLALSKQVRDDPRLFDNSDFHDTMLLHLDNNPDLVSVFVASDKGSFHQVQTMREGMILGNRTPPADAKYNFWVVVRSANVEVVAETTPPANNGTATSGKAGAGAGAGASNAATGSGNVVKKDSQVNSIFTFYKNRDTLLDTFIVPNNYDPRQRPFYKNLLANHSKPANSANERFVHIDEPYISVSTSRPTMNLAAPIVYDNVFHGMVGESFELATISKFLKSIQISKNCETFIIDTEGNIVVSTGKNSGYNIEKNKLIKQNVEKASGQPVQQAFQLYKANKQRRFEFVNPNNAQVYLAQLTAFPNSFNKNWEVLTLVPVSDFLEGLNEVNRRLITYGGFACMLLVLLTFILSRTISKPIEHLTEEIRDLLDFNRPSTIIESNIFEINILSDAVSKLRNTLRAFTSYVPRDLVNDLLLSGKNIELGGENRHLTIMFTDLKDFSTLSEITPPRALLKCVSAYLAMVTQAVKEESGTVDKFIGDSVMAFWGAPLVNQNHAFHSCVTAVKSQRRMLQLNQQLSAEGLPSLTMRIGIHSDAVLVGNIGSSERMSYTVMGDGVNIASRLEGINKEYGTSICISHATYKEAGEFLWARPIDIITVKGRKGAITIYELLGIRSDDPQIMITEREQALCTATTEAFVLFTQRQYRAAASAYQAIFDTYGDHLAYLMQSKCIQNLTNE